MEHSRPPQSPRRTRVHHPVSSYIPFFVFVGTLVLIVVVVIYMVGRLLTTLSVHLPMGQHPTAVPAITRPPHATVVGRRVRAISTSIPLPVVFALAHDRAAAPLQPARHFAPNVPHIYAFVTLRHVPAATPLHFVWVFGPHHVRELDVLEHAHGPAYAKHTFLSYMTPDAGAFTPGVYTVTVMLKDTAVGRGAFRVGGP